MKKKILFLCILLFSCIYMQPKYRILTRNNDIKVNNLNEVETFEYDIEEIEKIEDVTSFIEQTQNNNPYSLEESQENIQDYSPYSLTETPEKTQGYSLYSLTETPEKTFDLENDSNQNFERNYNEDEVLEIIDMLKYYIDSLKLTSEEDLQSQTLIFELGYDKIKYDIAFVIINAIDELVEQGYSTFSFEYKESSDIFILEIICK